MASPIFAPGAPVDLLCIFGKSLGPEGMLALGLSCKSLFDTVVGAQLEALWEGFAGGSLKSLISNETTSFKRYLQLNAVDLTGTWVDEGNDQVYRENFRYVTALRQLNLQGVSRLFTASAKIEPEEMKLSSGSIERGAYYCSEVFVRDAGGVSPVMNIAQGSLDLSDPTRPRVVGTWKQIELPLRGLHRSMVRVQQGEPPPSSSKLLTYGDFVSTRVSCIYDEHAWHNKELRELAGMQDETSLYIVTPMTSPVPGSP